MQKGLAQLLIIFAILILIGIGGFFIYLNNKSKPITPKESVQDTISPRTSDDKEYANNTLGISFKYKKQLVVKEDSEEEFNKRGNGDFRKNFESYIEYQPGKFLGAVVALDDEKNYETNPSTLWVFENLEDLTIEDWHDKYWYYPFVWGDFTHRGKIDYAPSEIATISGQLTKSKVLDYTKGNPRFVYLAKDKKMYLFRIVGETGEEVLKTVTIKSL